jgi:PilZ domain
MRRQTPEPQTLLVHDGELADVRALLEELETPFAERRELSAADREAPWDLVIASPRRILNLGLVNAEARPVSIAMLDQDSRTLRNSLRRADIRMMVRRPVHRATLRALIVHALYRGPEKRRSARVNIGAPVRYRSGWRSRPGILVDLSVGGCRVILDQQLARGRGFSLAIPAEIAGAAFTVKARVLSSGPHLGQPPDHFVASARFEQVRQRQHELLKRAVSAHADGPAVFTGEAPRVAGPASRAAPRHPAQPRRPARPPPPRLARRTTGRRRWAKRPAAS